MRLEGACPPAALRPAAGDGTIVKVRCRGDESIEQASRGRGAGKAQCEASARRMPRGDEPGVGMVPAQLSDAIDHVFFQLTDMVDVTGDP